jgi:hypothetical protein
MHLTLRALEREERLVKCRVRKSIYEGLRPAEHVATEGRASLCDATPFIAIKLDVST